MSERIATILRRLQGLEPVDSGALHEDDLKSLLKLHDQQITTYGQRLATDRALEGHIQKITEDVIGRWGKISPTMRRALVIAPFAQWLGAATRYVYVTLPKARCLGPPRLCLGLTFQPATPPALFSSSTLSGVKCRLPRP